MFLPFVLEYVRLTELTDEAFCRPAVDPPRYRVLPRVLDLPLALSFYQSGLPVLAPSFSRGWPPSDESFPCSPRLFRPRLRCLPAPQLLKRWVPSGPLADQPWLLCGKSQRLYFSYPLSPCPFPSSTEPNPRQIERFDPMRNLDPGL